MALRIPALIVAIALLDAPSPPASRQPASSDFLYLWASSADSSGPDFLAVYDVRDRPSADHDGALVTTLPVPGRGNRTHHTEYVMLADGQLFANGYASGQLFIFDLSKPSAPRLAKQFGEVGALMHPHSFWRLSDLSLQHTIELPNGPRGDEGFRSAEPRVLSDGKTVLVSTFNCGLYLLNDIASQKPGAQLVASFPRKVGTSCAVPAVAGNYYLVTVPAWNAVVVSMCRIRRIHAKCRA